jgi:hypothetical protein
MQVIPLLFSIPQHCFNIRNHYPNSQWPWSHPCYIHWGPTLYCHEDLQHLQPWVHKFSYTLGGIPKFLVTEGGNEASSILRIYKCYPPRCKIQSLRPPGARDLFTPDIKVGDTCSYAVHTKMNIRDTNGWLHAASTKCVELRSIGCLSAVTE